MGIYVYTLRKRALNLHHDSPNGLSRAVCNFFSYAYKEWSSYAWDDRVERRRQFIRDNAGRAAERAWDETSHELVVIADEKPQDGDAVYKDPQRPVWYDTDGFPGQLVGFLQKRGGQWHLVDATPWQMMLFGGSDGRCSERRWVRHRVIDGKSVQECVNQEDSGVADYDRAPRYELPGTRYPQIVDPHKAIEMRPVY